jgi:hypothetical protein
MKIKEFTIKSNLKITKQAGYRIKSIKQSKKKTIKIGEINIKDWPEYIEFQKQPWHQRAIYSIKIEWYLFKRNIIRLFLGM